jgi:hypothetical protein
VISEKIGEHLHQHRQHIFLAHQAAVEQRKTWQRHQNNKSGRHHQKRIVTFVGGGSGILSPSRQCQHCASGTQSHQ